MDELVYLEDERKKLWKEITSLKEQIDNGVISEINSLREYVDKKTPEAEKDARQASRKTSEFKNKAERNKELTDGYVAEVQKAASTIEAVRSECDRQVAAIKARLDQIDSLKDSIDEITEKSETIEALFENQDELSQKISNLAELSTSSEDSANKISAIYNNITKRKNELDTLYYQVFGTEEVDEDTGETVKVPGMVQELEAAFEKTKADIEGIKKNTVIFQSEVKQQLKDKLKENDDEFGKNLKGWKESHEYILGQIKALLPAAMTAGLSSAYSEKRVAEIAEGKKFSSDFRKSILYLVLCSLIPFAAGMVLLYQGRTLQETLLELPRLTLSIFPLYAPLLWLAYSTSKKIKLSKRLVEEYTHKEVLSKTFEGLSRQIDETDGELSQALRTKLLYNLLDTSSENPGKLISDYNNADHPVMDAIEKGAKLGQALDKLSKIPGVSKLADILERQRASELLAKEQQIEKGLASKAERAKQPEEEA
ncbi:hypothetical protein NAV33_20515 [Pseudomonas stutzeri]|uniref:hypothetical protein n=1 Tax=Stutzerimonas stutzeri TaxID=316 RepID=UPI00210D9106|nr:hypothetical protein [Stutzerimonas stutzeri]MCQ4314255.1 hypothetical protein [Stutzerimonas stutzeri]